MTFNLDFGGSLLGRLFRGRLWNDLDGEVEGRLDLVDRQLDVFADHFALRCRRRFLLGRSSAAEEEEGVALRDVHEVLVQLLLLLLPLRLPFRLRRIASVRNSFGEPDFFPKISDEFLRVDCCRAGSRSGALQPAAKGLRECLDAAEQVARTQGGVAVEVTEVVLEFLRRQPVDSLEGRKAEFSRSANPVFNFKTPGNEIKEPFLTTWGLYYKLL